VVSPAAAVAAFERAGVVFWTGVPDSLLKDFCLCVEEQARTGSHVIAANEGGAVAIAGGYHLATRRVAGIYLQNSGLGNTINPVVSFADPVVSGLPMVLLVGWRGEPGTADEPQHVRQGASTLPLLEALGVPVRVVATETDLFTESVDWAVTEAIRRAGPTALLVRAGTFDVYERSRDEDLDTHPSREDALEAVAQALPEDVAIVATTGKTSRELYEYRRRAGAPVHDFLTVGAMGHASQVALGVALARPERLVCVFDGDGAAVMHLGAFAVVGELGPTNLRHVVFNNHAHESVGGQPTPTRRLDFPALARAAGYRWAERVDTIERTTDIVGELESQEGPALLEIVIRQGSRPDLGRPAEAPAINRDEFMAWLER
jgi:phosphonopyruvate decarboxylase